MKSVFESEDYKGFIRSWVESKPSRGRGEYRKIAEALGISTTLVSQVVSGDKHLSMESSVDLADYLGLGERESEHFLLLVEHARAGTHRYRERLRKRLEMAQKKAQQLSERLEKDRVLSDHEAATYY